MTALPTRATVTPLAGASRKVVELHGWTGWVPSLQEVMDRYRRPGGSGGGAQSTGTESEMTTISAWRCEMTFTTAEAFIASLEALQGIVCSIKDPWNRNIKRARIWNAKGIPRPGRGPQVQGAATATILVDVRLTVERLPDG